MADWKPNRKVGSAAAIGTPLSIIVIYIVNSILQAPLPETVSSAIAALIPVLIAYFVPLPK
jgi:hypothetical protein